MAFIAKRLATALAARGTSNAPRRTVVTFANEQVQARVKDLSKSSADFAQKLETLQKSKNQYKFQTGPSASYQHRQRLITVRARQDDTESIAHETFHAIHHEHIERVAHSQPQTYGDPDSLADNVFSSKQHLSLAEAGALSSGLRTSLGTAKDWLVRHQGYVDTGRVAPFKEAEKLLNKPYHRPVLEELSRNK